MSYFLTYCVSVIPLTAPLPPPNNYWKGTLVLKNCGREQNVNYPAPAGETHGVVRFDQYGSANSVIRAPGYKGISAVANQNTTCPATLFIDATPGQPYARRAGRVVSGSRRPGRWRRLGPQGGQPRLGCGGRLPLLACSALRRRGRTPRCRARPSGAPTSG